MGIANTLKEQAVGISQKAIERLFADERRAQKVAEVIGKAQQAKKTLDSTQRVVMHQFNFATRQDFKELGKQLSGIKKRLRSIEEKVGSL
jgi:chromosome segregation and condensation protein ScpB